MNNSNDLYRLTKENYELKIKLLEIEKQTELRAMRLLQKEVQPSRASLDEGDEDDNESNNNDVATGVSAEAIGLDYEKARKLIQTLEYNKEYSGLWIIHSLIGRIPSNKSEKTVCTNFFKRISSLEKVPSKRGEKPGMRDSEFNQKCYYYRRVMPAIADTEEEI